MILESEYEATFKIEVCNKIACLQSTEPIEVKTYCNQFSRKIIAPTDMLNINVMMINGNDLPIKSKGF